MKISEMIAKAFIAHINEVHRRPNNRPDLTATEEKRMAELFKVHPNTKRINFFGVEIDLVIK